MYFNQDILSRELTGHYLGFLKHASNDCLNYSVLMINVSN